MSVTICNRWTGKTIWQNQELANLYGANLSGADLRDADLRDANLRATQYVIRIHGRQHAITAVDDDVWIGCIRLQIDQWLQRFQHIGAEQLYLPEEIEEYGMHLRHIAAVLEMRGRLVKRAAEGDGQ